MGGDDNAEVSVYDQFQQALAVDQSWAWSWFCNIAVPLTDTIGVSHHDANVAAAHLMKHLFKIDVTGWKEYQDIINHSDTKQTGTKAVLKETTVDVNGIDESAIYINVTGFKANSGAEITAKGLYELLRLQGYRANLNIADTTLGDDERSLKVPSPGAVFVVTGVESRWHTDQAGASVLEEQAEQIVDAYTADKDEREQRREEALDTVEEDDDFGGDDCGDFDEGEEWPDAGDCDEEDASHRTGTTDVDLILFGLDTNPIGTLKYVEKQLPKANIRVRLELDEFVTSAIYQELNSGKRGALTLYQADPDRTVVHALSQIADNDQEGLTMAPEEIKLSNPEHLIKAYLLHNEEDGTYSIQYIDVDSPSFDFQKYMSSKFEVVHTYNSNVFSLALYSANKEVATNPEYNCAINTNNSRFVARFGLKSDYGQQQRKVKDKLDFYNLDQMDIPDELWNFLEASWISLLDPVVCEELADELDDPRASMRDREYDLYAGSFPGITHRKHPYHEELFVKLVLKEADVNPAVKDWAIKMGLI